LRLFTGPPSTQMYSLSLHDALPILKHVICSTFEDLELEDNSLSNVGLFDVLEHIEDDTRTLKILRRKLKLNKGRLFLTVPAFSRSEEHTSELQSREHLVCRLLLEKK